MSAGPSPGDRVIESLRGAHRRTAEPILLATVSGIATTNPEMIEWFARETAVTIITSKSIQVRPNPGNREPVITEPEPGSFGNAVGLKNPGLAAALLELRELRRRLSARADPARSKPLLNISIAGRDPEEFSLLAGKLAPLADLLELNLSCPHAHGGYGSVIGCDRNLVERCTRAAVDAAGATPVFAKLTPNVAAPGELAAIARRAVEAGAAGIVAINTVGPDQYREPETGALILNNPAPPGSPDAASRSGLGGRSGRWIRERALACIREIRDGLGPEVPLIGMGGVELPEDARALRDAGADVVGVGSVLALVHQKEWPRLFRDLADGFRNEGSDPSRPLPAYYREEGNMRFQRRTVAARRELGGGLFELELEGTFAFEAGQSCFLWLPGVGEKPFSPALDEPATFLIRRRGLVTDALGRLERGDSLFIRGPYGSGEGVIDATMAAPADGAAPGSVALILVAGSGAALAPTLAKRLAARGVAVRVMIGLRDDTTAVPLEQAIRRHADLQVLRDQGVIGRVLRVAEDTYGGTGESASPAYPETRRTESLNTLWAIGPDPFMEGAMDLGIRLGLDRDRIWISLEEEMLCGTGLCGMCHRGGRLTCAHGTFVTMTAAGGAGKESCL
ncbi:MAG: dihydroorotate dehydrogenase [Spirochaetaceae bacterium]|nr:MAG: dihydroorotate dehydrogenase [Spirochaetaceae bacterium]